VNLFEVQRGKRNFFFPSGRVDGLGHYLPWVYDLIGPGREKLVAGLGFAITS
jgi:hypothetical protein